MSAVSFFDIADIFLIAGYGFNIKVCQSAGTTSLRVEPSEYLTMFTPG